MSLPISAIGTPAAIPSIQTPASPASAGGFGAVLNDAVSRVEQFQQNSAGTIANFLSGEGGEVHQVALATQQAEISFDLFLQVRNKVIAAYQEVMRMQM